MTQGGSLMQRAYILRIVFGYAVVAGLYILFSDTLLHALALSPATVEWISVFKGLGFVLVTSGALWLLLQHLRAGEDARKQRAVERLLALYNMLSQSSQLLVKATSRQELFERLCYIAVAVGGVRIASISLLDANREMQPVAHAGATPGVARHNGNLPIEEVRAALERGELDSCLSIPVRRGRDLIGCFELYSDEPDFFGAREVDTLHAMIDDLAFGLDNLLRVATLEVATNIVESSSVVLYRVDEITQMRLTFVTENVRQWGYSATSLLSGLVRFEQIAHPDDLPRLNDNLERYIGERREQYTEVFRILTADKTPRWVEDKTIVRYTPDGKFLYLQGALTDITDSYRMQLALHDSETRYRTMVDNSPDLLFINTGGLISFVNPSGVRMLGAKNADELVGKPVFSIIRPDHHALVRERIRIAKGQPGIKLPTAIIPFCGVDGSTLAVEVTATSFLSDGNLDILVFGHDVSFRERANATIQDYVQKLEKAMIATTAAVSQMVELRDPYTAGHERRVGIMAADIAREMGLDENVQRGLQIAGALHDVGKITVPSEILTKPGRLTSVEYELVKQHAEQGYLVLSQVEFPWPIADVAYQHHERIDGSGYPRGLKGDAIALEARIVAVANVVESVSSHRPYRPARGIAVALDEIEKGRGTLYDTAVADACLRLFREKAYTVPL
jgi:PAS domain S-box-containing protein